MDDSAQPDTLARKAEETTSRAAAKRAAPSPRRTFAIISHPDAGKTTLTEKLLLFGGAIREAGMVRARRERRHTRSDWLKIEQERGISVSSSVMTFAFEETIFNLLDTPGHQDFSEDTYRTLTAVDSAVMVIDAAKGIESQTRKLFEVCRLRDIPIITFINKVDHEGRDPFGLVDEIAADLALDVSPMSWPIGMGGLFQGCWDIAGDRLIEAERPDAAGTLPEDPEAVLAPERLAALREELALIRVGYPAFDVAAYRAGQLTPIYFGSALKDYGVRELLRALVAYAPPPRAQAAASRTVEAAEEKVTAVVFKVQANMDPHHHDRVAFTRICSGRFTRGMKLLQVRTGKFTTIQAPIFFFARNRSLAEEAWPGDIIGIPNHGTLRVGDTLSEGERLRFTGMPSFAPEILRRVRLQDPMHAKQMRRALEDMAEEGVVQVFRPRSGAPWIVGVVGALQLDVLAARIANEYHLSVAFDPVSYETARWIASSDPPLLQRFVDANRQAISDDPDGAPVFLARNAWELAHVTETWPGIRFAATHERA